MLENITHLNTPQKEAVFHKEGPLLVIAGAGAGKTRVITHRITSLINSGIDPSRILAVTFTNKAAQEMRDRVKTLLTKNSSYMPPDTEYQIPFIGTFHALGVRILRERGSAIGVNQRFIIKDKQDSRALMKKAMREAEINSEQFDVRRIQGVISKEKGNLTTLEKYEGGAMGEFFPELVVSVWQRYEAFLEKERALDFDDLLLKTHLLLSLEKDVREYYQNRWHYIHIDEYQDTNHAQYIISKVLAGEKKNICAVGDGDQCIYGWRGARMRNLLRFEKDYPNTKIIFLEENYRSTKTILGAANHVIEKNTERFPKRLFTQKGAGDLISLYIAPNHKDEALYIAEKVQKLFKGGTILRDIAILYRTNFQSRILEESFLSLGVPYQVLGTRFFERKEVRDMLSFIRVAQNRESISDMARVVNIPPRGIGKVTIAKMFTNGATSLSPSMRQKVDSLYTLLQKINNASKKIPPSALLKYILKETGLDEHLKKEGDEGFERLENIKELVTLASRYDTLPQEEALEKFLEDAALASDQDTLIQKSEGVKLMTVHAAKGLEFPYVFIAGLEQGLFPHERSYKDAGRFNNETGEEERRLFYVALTRAQKKIFLSCAEIRAIFGSLQINVPSEFIGDIPEKLIEMDALKEYEEKDGEVIEF